MKLSTYGANAIYNGTQMPATLYIKQHVGAPGPDGTANPAQETSRPATGRSTSTEGACSNDTELEYTDVTATPSETWTHFTAWDAATDGNCWGGGTTAANPVSEGDTARCPVGDLDLSFDLLD
ncbi:MAG: hypothetical protein AB7G37_03490 [Solirubrobacteraceae bacterium]